jgi:hypothetical protein
MTTVTVTAVVVPTSPPGTEIEVTAPARDPIGNVDTGVKLPTNVPAVQATDGVMVAVAIVNGFAVKAVDGTASVRVPPVAVPAFVNVPLKDTDAPTASGWYEAMN